MHRPRAWLPGGRKRTAAAGTPTSPGATPQPLTQVRSLSTFCLSETRQVWGNRSKAKLTGLWRNKQGAGPTRCLQFPRTGSGEGPPSECGAASPCRGPGSRSIQLLDVKTGKVPTSLEKADSFSAGEGG